MPYQRKQVDMQKYEKNKLSILYNAHVEEYKKFQKSGGDYLRSELEKAIRNNCQPEHVPHITLNKIQENWDILQPYYAALRKLPLSELLVYRTQKHKYQQMRQSQPWYPAYCVMEEQAKKDVVRPETLVMIARAMRKNYSEIDVLKLNPLDVMRAFVSKNKSKSYDWEDWKQFMLKYGYDQNGQRMAEFRNLPRDLRP